MINPERMIQGLLSEALGGGFGKKKKKKKGSLFSSKGLIGSNKAAIGMGLLGVAIAAFDHFQQSKNPPGAGGIGPLPTSGGGAPPPPPGTTSGTAAVPPPPPPSAAPGPSVSAAEREQEALLIMRAMIAAAHADYTIDPEERAGILEKAREGGLSPEELALVEQELEHPKNLAEIAASATTPQQAEEVYVASLIAIAIDTEAERAYLRSLRERLKLPAETVDRWHRQFDISPELS